MTYNQKIWLGVLLLCTLFWGAVISGACSLYNRTDRLNGTRRRASSPPATVCPTARSKAFRPPPPPGMGRDKTG